MAKVKKKSVIPLYAVAVLWLFCGLFLPFYELGHYINAVVISIVVFLVARKLCPTQVFETVEPEIPPEPVSTGNEKLDALIDERNKAISEMRRLNDNIEDADISARIDHLERTTTKIIDQVIAHPEKLPQIRKFMNYYLPTTLKLLNAYDRMDSVGVSGSNIDSSLQKISDMLDTIGQAFDKQLDALFGDDAMDVSTDIKVMESMLQREGLGGMQL